MSNGKYRELDAEIRLYVAFNVRGLPPAQAAVLRRLAAAELNCGAWSSRSADLISRRLQALRKAGEIRYVSKGDRWELVTKEAA